MAAKTKIEWKEPGALCADYANRLLASLEEVWESCPPTIRPLVLHCLIDCFRGRVGQEMERVVRAEAYRLWRKMPTEMFPGGSEQQEEYAKWRKD